MDSLPSDAARLRTAIARADRLLAREGAGAGLTRTELSVLGAVARMDSASLALLADREGLNPSMLSRVVTALTNAGLVQRRSHPDDGRQGVVEITPAGAELYDRLQRDRTALLADYLDRLPAEDAATLHRSLDVIEGLVEHLRTARVPS